MTEVSCSNPLGIRQARTKKSLSLFPKKQFARKIRPYELWLARQSMGGGFKWNCLLRSRHPMHLFVQTYARTHARTYVHPQLAKRVRKKLCLVRTHTHTHTHSTFAPGLSTAVLLYSAAADGGGLFVELASNRKEGRKEGKQIRYTQLVGSIHKKDELTRWLAFYAKLVQLIRMLAIIPRPSF